MHAKPDLRVEFEPDSHHFRLGDLCRYLLGEKLTSKRLTQKREFGQEFAIRHEESIKHYDSILIAWKFLKLSAEF